MSIPLWFFLIVFAWAVLMTTLWSLRDNPLLQDRGHRCFAVPNEEAAKVVVSILGELGGLKEEFTFDTWPAVQTLLSDGTTVIVSYNEAFFGMGLDPNGFSVVVKNPKRSTQRAAEMLREAGFTARVEKGLVPGLEDKLVLLTSNAFDGWTLTFRRHALKMGMPPGRRKEFN